MASPASVKTWDDETDILALEKMSEGGRGDRGGPSGGGAPRA